MDEMKNESLFRIGQSAYFLSSIWKSHDEKDKEKCGISASLLYVMMKSSNPYTALVDIFKSVHSQDENSKFWDFDFAGRLVADAFWKADEAEGYMGVDETLEEKCYQEAGILLSESRDRVGLETDSTYYTQLWWRDYRHKNKESLRKNLIKEQELQSGNKSDSEKLADLLLEAALFHKSRDWDKVENKLQEYFNILYGYNFDIGELYLSRND